MVGDDGDALLRVALIVDEDAGEDAAGQTLADADGQVLIELGEAAGLQNVGQHVGGDLGVPLLDNPAHAVGRQKGCDEGHTATTQVAKKNGRNSWNGEKPAAFITMISELVANLFRVRRKIAIISAIGAMISTSAGITRLVMPRKVTMV